VCCQAGTLLPLLCRATLPTAVPSATLLQFLLNRAAHGSTVASARCCTLLQSALRRAAGSGQRYGEASAAGSGGSEAGAHTKASSKENVFLPQKYCGIFRVQDGDGR
jgi:hypothetical protein